MDYCGFSKQMSWLPLLILAGLQMTLVTCSSRTPLTYSDAIDNGITKKREAELPSILKRYYPLEKNMKLAKLLRRLQDNFDKDWMAITRPDPISDNNNPSSKPETNDTLAETHKQVQSILENRNMSVDDPKLEPLVQFLTSTLSSCAVRYEWTDLGELFWPRFIKSGLCTSEKSCSWPHGMTCMPGKLMVVRILRWRCKRRRGAADRKRRARGRKNRQRKTKTNLSCSWKLIPYHVPVDCECSC